MSEYQYYEFQAIDRSLDEADRQALRALSSRARISATRFVNTYDFGDFGGNPLAMMERWFDLHLYLANWGTRRLMMRLPGRPIDRSSVDTFLRHVDCAETTVAGDHWILSVSFHDEEGDWDEAPFDDCDDADWLAAIAPLRADVIGGDLRLFYLLWLMAVEDGSLPDHELEPLPGLGPLTGALEAFAAFFYIDSVLVAAAAEQRADPALTTPQASAQVRSVIAAMPDQEKSRLLEFVRLFQNR